VLVCALTVVASITQAQNSAERTEIVASFIVLLLYKIATKGYLRPNCN
jgi:hypothetical protein